MVDLVVDLVADRLDRDPELPGLLVYLPGVPLLVGEQDGLVVELRSHGCALLALRAASPRTPSQPATVRCDCVPPSTQRFIRTSRRTSAAITPRGPAVDSVGRRSFGPFVRFEARAKVAKGHGLNSALWLMLEVEGKVCPWPRCGEIDIMECLGKNTSIGYGDYHWAADSAPVRALQPELSGVPSQRLLPCRTTTTLTSCYGRKSRCGDCDVLDPRHLGGRRLGWSPCLCRAARRARDRCGSGLRWLRSELNCRSRSRG